jgi:hypothetical protein
MAVPHIDTFEHDIANEIKNKEASITDIASAGNDIGNLAEPQGPTPTFLFAIAALSVVLVIAAVAGLYVFVIASSDGAGSRQSDTRSSGSQTGDDGQPDLLASVSPTLHTALRGAFGTSVRNDYGYAFAILDYSQVFAYMIRNEQEYADELATAVGAGRDRSTSSPPFQFTDVTLRNQNMRVGTDGQHTVVYAFVLTNALVVSSSTEGILALRSGILAQ